MQNVMNQSAAKNGVSVVCSNCGEVLQVSSPDSVGKVKAELVETGEIVTLTYVSCGKCNRRSYVQVDNDKTLDRLDTIQRLLITGKKKFAKKLDEGLYDMRQELRSRVEGCEASLDEGDGERKQFTLRLVM